MAEGDVATDGYSSTKQGYFFPQRSIGSRTIVRELIGLHNLWVPLVQMCQVAPGHKWCSCCGDVRPYTYFDPITWDADGEPTDYFHTCKQCANARDPKLRPMKYCSACKADHPRADFADDSDYTDGKYPNCYASEARRKAAKRARDAWLNEGRVLRSWQRVGV